MDAVGPYLAVLEPLYLTAVGDTPLAVVLKDWVPLLACVVLPLLCLPFVALGCCGDRGPPEVKFGARMALRKVSLASRTAIRMGHDAQYSKLLKSAGFSTTGPSYAKPTSSAVKHLDKASLAQREKNKAEEAAIKAKASPPKK